MNRKIKILSISSLLLGLTFGVTSCSCEKEQPPVKDDDEVINLPYEEPTTSRTISFKETGTLTQGSLINLNDYVVVNPGMDESFDERSDLSFDYEILVDNVSPSKVSTFSLLDSSPSVVKAKTLALLRPGKQVIRITSKKATAYLELDIQKNSKYQTVLDAYSQDIINFEVSRQFAFNEKMELEQTESKEVLIQKAENYYFNPTELMGMAVHLNSNLAYYYWFNEKLENPLRVAPNGTNDATISAQGFKDSFGSFKNIFSETNLQFDPAIDEVFGSEYSYCLPYLEETQTVFAQALNLLGVRQTQKINGTTYYRSYLIPKVGENNSLEIYSVLLSASGNAYLEGPYKIENQGKVKLEAIEDFVTGEGLDIAQDTSFITNKFSTFKNYTLKSEGHFEDMDGKNIDDVEYFKGYLDSFDLTIKVTDDALYFSDISRVDGSNDKEAILKDLPVQGGLETYKYVKEGGSFVKQKDPMVDPYNDSVIYGWQKSSTFGNYKPALAFKSDIYKYGAYINNGTHYSLVGLNDSSSNSAMKQFIRAIAYDGLVASGAPIAYYIAAGWMDFSLGESATSDVNCDFRVRLTTSTNYVYYCLKLSVTDINSTKISL